MYFDFDTNKLEPKFDIKALIEFTLKQISIQIKLKKQKLVIVFFY